MRYLSPQGNIEDWIERSCAGDERAFDRLYVHLAPQVTAFVMEQIYPGTARWTQPEEIVERAFEEVFRTLAKSPCRTEAELVRRLRRVAYERMVDAARGAQKLAGESATPPMNGHPVASTPSTGPVTHAEEQAMLHRLIEALPEKHARVIRLRVVEELEFPAIGERLGITADAAYRRYVKARRILLDRTERFRDE